MPIELVQRSSTKGAGYTSKYMQCLQAVGKGELDGIVPKMLATMKATDPANPDVTSKDWTLYLHVPQIEVFIYVVTEDQRYAGALQKAVELHKKYWEKTKDRRRDYWGMVSIELSALAAMGRSRGLKHEVESPYLLAV